VSLRQYLMGESPPPVREIETRGMELLCKLHDETSKTAPDTAVVSSILEDLDVLVADYRREKVRK
jgi:hypothetical protein